MYAMVNSSWALRFLLANFSEFKKNRLFDEKNSKLRKDARIFHAGRLFRFIYALSPKCSAAYSRILYFNIFPAAFMGKASMNCT